MPLTEKGRKVMGAMKKEYGEKKGEQVFYASANKGTIKNVHRDSVQTGKGTKTLPQMAAHNVTYTRPLGKEGRTFKCK